METAILIVVYWLLLNQNDGEFRVSNLFPASLNGAVTVLIVAVVEGMLK